MLSNKQRVWLVFWAASLLVVVASAGASSWALFGGSEQGEDMATSDPGSESVSVNGATVRVVATSTDAADVVISVEIEGADDLGPEVISQGFASVIDANGTRHLEIGGRIEGRVLQLRFSASDYGPGPWKLQLEGLGLGSRGRMTQALGNVRLPLEISAAEPIDVQRIDRDAEFGGLKIVVDTARTTPHRAVLEGRILRLPAGLSFEEFGFLGSEFISEDGTRLHVEEARIGSRNDPAVFELVMSDERFAATVNSWTLTVPVREKANAPGQLAPATGVLSLPLSTR